MSTHGDVIAAMQAADCSTRVGKPLPLEAKGNARIVLWIESKAAVLVPERSEMHRTVAGNGKRALLTWEHAKQHAGKMLLVLLPRRFLCGEATEGGFQPHTG